MSVELVSDGGVDKDIKERKEVLAKGGGKEHYDVREALGLGTGSENLKSGHDHHLHRGATLISLRPCGNQHRLRNT